MVFPVHCTSSIYLHLRVMKIVLMIHKSSLIMFRRLQLSTEAVISDFSGRLINVYKMVETPPTSQKRHLQLDKEVK